MIRCSPSKWSGKTSHHLFTFFNPLFKMPDTYTNGCEICEIQASNGEQRVISAWRSFLSLPLFLSSAVRRPPSGIRHPPSASAHPYPPFTESRWSMTKRSILIGLGQKIRTAKMSRPFELSSADLRFWKDFRKKTFFFVLTFSLILGRLFKSRLTLTWG